MFYKNPYYDPSKKHHTIRGFRNLEPFAISKKDFVKWRQERKIHPPKEGYEKFIQDWFQPADFTVAQEGIWWLGHASSLIRINQKTILIDPVFSEYASPFSFIGPKRRTPCPTSVDQLPNIDFVLISHNHYDHLDYPTIKQLIKRFPDITFFVPLGLRKKLLKWGANQVIELDWWDSFTVSDIKLTAVPAQHWSRRALFDTNRSLWCGWMIEYPHYTIYFMGDSGYANIFNLIGQRFPNIDLALIPIGCYAPQWFMHKQHIDPRQSVQIFKQLNCKRAIAIHWGVFELADDALDEPPKFLQALTEQELDHKQLFSLLKIGQHTTI